MKAYEGLFFLPPDATADGRKNQLKNIESLITKYKGKVLQITEWGKRPVGYNIKKNHEAHGVVIDFQLDSLKVAELRGILLLQEDILKFMITAKNPKVEKRIAQAKADAAKNVKTGSAETIASPSH